MKYSHQCAFHYPLGEGEHDERATAREEERMRHQPAVGKRIREQDLADRLVDQIREHRTEEYSAVELPARLDLEELQPHHGNAKCDPQMPEEEHRSYSVLHNARDRVLTCKNARLHVDTAR